MNRKSNNTIDTPEIPLHRIVDFAPNCVSAHLYGTGYDAVSWQHIEDYTVHRDDHYIFLVLEEGHGTLDVDFHTIELRDHQLYIITPGQLHGNIKARGSRGWVVVVSPEYIESSLRELFAQNMFNVQAHALSPGEMTTFNRVLRIMVDEPKGESRPLFREILWSVTELFINLVGRVLAETQITSGKPDTHKRHIAYRFKELVRLHFRQQKSAQFYAAQLNVTPGYLNEVLNYITGQPTSRLIIEEVLLEAKRLLIVTDLTAKEVAYALGYENYSYFNRMFRSKTGMTPLQFRESNRE